MVQVLNVVCVCVCVCVSSAVPRIFVQGGGSADIVSLLSRGSEMTLIRALLSLCQISRGAAVPSSPPAQYGPGVFIPMWNIS